MQRLTDARLLERLDDALDVSGTPYFPAAQKADALSSAYLDWLAEWAARPERAEGVRARLSPLTRQQTLSAPGGVADLSALARPLFALRAVEVQWTPGGEWLPVTPLSHDARAVALTDPWRRPTPNAPRYSTTGEGSGRLTLHPEGVTPQALRVTYLARPEAIGAGDGETDVDRAVQEELILRAAVKLAVPSANAGAWQGHGAELAKTT